MANFEYVPPFNIRFATMVANRTALHISNDPELGGCVSGHRFALVDLLSIKESCTRHDDETGEGSAVVTCRYAGGTVVRQELASFDDENYGTQWNLTAMSARFYTLKAGVGRQDQKTSKVWSLAELAELANQIGLPRPGGCFAAADGKVYPMDRYDEIVNGETNNSR